MQKNKALDVLEQQLEDKSGIKSKSRCLQEDSETSETDKLLSETKKPKPYCIMKGPSLMIISQPLRNLKS